MKTVQTQTQKRKMNTKLVVAPFDRAIAQLNDAGYKPASLRNAAQARIQQGRNADVSTNGFYVAETVLYIPGRGNYLVPAEYSPILASPTEATNAHRNGSEFYVEQEKAEQIAQNSIVFPAKDIEVPTNRLSQEELFAKSMGEDTAKEYGEFLAEAGINAIPIVTIPQDYVNKQKQPFAKQPWLWSLDSRSELYGFDWLLGLLYGDSGVLGVRRGKTGGASAQKIEAYTPKQMREALSGALKARGIKIDGLEGQILEALRSQRKI